MDYAEAARRFDAAIELDPRNVPAYLNLGDVRFYQGDAAGAIAQWERLIDKAPERAYLAFARLEGAYPKVERPGAVSGALPAADCRQPAGLAGAAGARRATWRSTAARAKRSSCSSKRWCTTRTRWRCTRRSGRSLSQLHFSPALVERYVDLTRDAIFYLDPHICIRCRYRSTELLWQCPQCHEWNTFVEERIAPAKDTEASLTS